MNGKGGKGREVVWIEGEWCSWAACTVHGGAALLKVRHSAMRRVWRWIGVYIHAHRVREGQVRKWVRYGYLEGSFDAAFLCMCMLVLDQGCFCVCVAGASEAVGSGR